MFSLTLLLIGCNPQDVSIEDANFHAWLANKSSSTVTEARLTCDDGVDNNGDGLVDGDDAQCQGTTSPNLTEENRCSDGNDNDGDGLVDGDDNDCSTGLAEVPYLDPREITTINCASGEELAGVCADDVNSAEYISWIKDDVYFLSQGAVEPWRSEGIITSEGDLQVTVHHDLGAGADFRFAFVVDPNFRPSVCIQEGQSCYTGEDGDGDGWVDYEDPDCLYGSWEGGFTDSACNDGFDNDGDSFVDRDDEDCEHPFDTSEASTDPSCEDGDDNDADGWIDSADPDCAVTGAAESGFSATECNDNIDNDGDTLIDMDDDSCANALDNGEGGPNNKRICRDEFDNDGDGWIDDDDPECTIYGEEAGLGFTACNDGLDNDNDGDIDSDDLGCALGYDGSEGTTDGTCSDGTDNDGDGWADSDDPDCLLGDAEDDTFFGIASCNDGIDNPDEDGTLDEEVDADDSDCKNGWDNAEERISSGSCTDGEDNDGDGWVDAQDSECLYGGVENYLGLSACNDGLDNDLDGDTDAEDVDCLFGTQMTEDSFGADCDDGVDNDGDSWIDSDDVGCMLGGDEISNVSTECADGIDNDLDGFADSEDPDCFNGGDTVELTDDACADGIDNDADGWVDSDDTDCQTSSIAYERGLGIGDCEDGLDNDGDTLVDGADAGCTNALDANEEEFDQCADGVDNDADGWVDALDPDCSGGSVYEDGTIAVSQCNDGTDNDSDGLTDFDDPECGSAWDNIEEAQIAGAPIPMDIDYGSAVENWSADEDGHEIFYINAGSYQLNPYDDEVFWVLPQEWLSGYAIAKYGSEEFDVLPNDFTYIGADAQAPNPDAYLNAIAAIEETAGVWASEYESYAYMASDVDGPLFELKVEGNEWRPLDLSDAGLDNWAEIHHSWVRVADGATYEVGSSLSGDFQIYLAGFESGSSLVVRGSFSIDSLGDDPWSYGDLEAELREQNNTVTCEF